MNELLGFTYRFLPASQTGAATLLLLHGTGGSENDLLSLGQKLLPGSNLLAPRGQVLENGMARYFRRLSEGLFDEADLLLQTEHLTQFVNEAISTYQLEADKLIAVGYSNGANMAATLLLLRPELLAAAILLRPMLPLEPATLPCLEGKPVFLASGLQDAMVPTHNVEKLAKLLQNSGAVVTHHWKNSGHGLAQEEIEAAKDWLAHHSF